MNAALRRDADVILRSSLNAVLPDEAVRRALRDLRPGKGRVLLVAAGKAAWQMAHAAVETLGVEMARLLFGSEIRMCGSEPLPEPVPGLDRGYDCILPVPASSKKRGYNVPERMAQPLARAVGVPVVTDALTRARSTRRQEGLSLDERLANVAGAFRVARPEAVEGKRILLVDDVLTTGATASACAQALLDAGAQSVFAVALATVEFPQPVGSTTAIAENEEEI